MIGITGKAMINDKMNKQEILDAAYGISNSLYNLRKNGEIDGLDEETYKDLRSLINDFGNGFAWEILMSNSRNREKETANE